jgi:hypothetical protein
MALYFQDLGMWLLVLQTQLLLAAGTVCLHMPELAIRHMKALESQGH